MARLIFLDSGPLGLACGPRKNPDVLRFEVWLAGVLAASRTHVILPEIADYEVRRGLLSLPDGARSVSRLDGLAKPRGVLDYAPITTAIMRQAAKLWAEARTGGYRTAGEEALDGDVILAAMALEYIGEGDQLLVATGNEPHLSRYLGARARHWEAITP